MSTPRASADQVLPSDSTADVLKAVYEHLDTACSLLTGAISSAQLIVSEHAELHVLCAKHHAVCVKLLQGTTMIAVCNECGFSATPSTIRVRVDCTDIATHHAMFQLAISETGSSLVCNICTQARDVSNLQTLLSLLVTARQSSKTTATTPNRICVQTPPVAASTVDVRGSPVKRASKSHGRLQGSVIETTERGKKRKHGDNTFGCTDSMTQDVTRSESNVARLSPLATGTVTVSERAYLSKRLTEETARVRAWGLRLDALVQSEAHTTANIAGLLYYLPATKLVCDNPTTTTAVFHNHVGNPLALCQRRGVDPANGYVFQVMEMLLHRVRILKSTVGVMSDICTTAAQLEPSRAACLVREELGPDSLGTVASILLTIITKMQSVLHLVSDEVLTANDAFLIIRTGDGVSVNAMMCLMEQVFANVEAVICVVEAHHEKK